MHSLSYVIEERRRQGAKGQTISKELERNKLVSWFSNFVSWQGATNAHSLSSVIEERRRQGAKGQTKWVIYFFPAPKLFLAGSIANKGAGIPALKPIGSATEAGMDAPEPQDRDQANNGGDPGLSEQNDEQNGLTVLPQEGPDEKFMETLEEQDHPAVEQREPTDIVLGQITLIVMSGASVNQGYHFTFLKTRPILMIGSDKNKCGEHSIILSAENVSPCHASIRWREGKFYLQDEGAAEGSYLEGERLIPHTMAPLKPRCSIRLGRAVLQYRLEFPEPLPQAEAPISALDALEKKETGAEGFVIAEFTLKSLDAPCALPHNCEMLSNKPHFVIGRAGHCDYQVEFKEKYVADEQALIVYSAREQAFAIKGVVKENPVFVNNQRVEHIQRLKSGDVLRLGIATNAPKVRFTIEGEEYSTKQKVNLAEALPALERGKIYRIGNSSDCRITINDPAISGAIAELQVPERGEHLLVNILANDAKVAIDGVALKERESRALGLHQTLEIGNFYELIHNQQNFIAPRVPVQCRFSEIVPTPKRGEIYAIGSGSLCHFRIDAAEAPAIIAEIIVPIDGDSFLVKRLGAASLPVTLDGEALTTNPRVETRFGVNQVLAIGDYLHIRNNHRTLPPPVAKFPWSKIIISTLLFMVITIGAVGLFYVGKKYWNQFNVLLSTQQLMKRYQGNVFYIAVFPKEENNKQGASGTGFLYVQKDVYERDIYYLITCKHVIQPWKFEKHRQKDGKVFGADGKELRTSYYIAVWPFKSAAIKPESRSYLLQNCFTNHPTQEKLGDVEIYRQGKDVFQKLPQNFRQHFIRSNHDIVILKLKPKVPRWNYDYHPWSLIGDKKLDVGEDVIVLGYSLGGGRLLNKKGLVVPASCEGKLTSECQPADFLEIDVNQTQGASGGPIINSYGHIVGMVSFSDKDKKLVYGIHAAVLQQLLK